MWWAGGGALMLDSQTLDVALELLGGLVLEIAGRIPKNGEEVRYSNYKFTVISVTNNRIEKVKVTNEI